MLSNLPVDLKKTRQEDIDREILRAGMIAELDAVSFYEQMASMTKSKIMQKVLMDIAKEEKTHAGEFQALLLELDMQQKEELDSGKREVEELKNK